MPFATFAAGPFDAMHNGEAAGEVEGVRRWQRFLDAELPRQGSIDGIYRGGQCFCLMTFRKWTKETASLIVVEESGLLSNHAQELVLSENGSAVLTFGKAVLSPGHNSEIVLQAEARAVPVVFRCFPYVSGSGKVVWFEEEKRGA